MQKVKKKKKSAALSYKLPVLFKKILSGKDEIKTINKFF